jgi:hypothetical protein
MPPKYDFDAAQRLSQQLSQLIQKLDWFIWLRLSKKDALLGGQHSDNWQGKKRDRFQTDFLRQHAALTEVRNAAIRVQSQVAQATEAAHAAEKNKR